MIPAVLVVACSSSTALVAAGGECFAASDCAPGLVCVPLQKDGPRVCSADLSQVTGRPPAEAAAPDAGDADAPVSDADPDTSTPDTGVDTGVKDAGDAG